MLILCCGLFTIKLITFCFSDVDECEEDASLCENGECVNTPGSYRCECDTGYRYEPNSNTCIVFFRFIVKYIVVLVRLS